MKKMMSGGRLIKGYEISLGPSFRKGEWTATGFRALFLVGLDVYTCDHFLAAVKSLFDLGNFGRQKSALA